MAQNDNILQELKELDSLLAYGGSGNVYRVPEGYFEGLALQVFRRIRALDAANATEEIGHLSSLLAGDVKKMPYAVPAGYFEGLAEQVMRRIRVMEAGNASAELDGLSPFLNNIPREMPYTVPAGYFDDLATTALAVVKDDHQSAGEELKELSPLLSGLKKEMPYSVPSGYFDGMDRSTGIEEQKPAAKVIPMAKQKWFRYAAAAVVISFVTLSGLLYFNRGGAIDPNSQSSEWVAKNMKKVSNDDIDSFVHQVVDEETPVIAQADVKESREIKELVKDIPEEDLQKFVAEAEPTMDEEENIDEIFVN